MSTKPAYTFRNDPDTGFYSQGGDISFVASGNDTLRKLWDGYSGLAPLAKRPSFKQSVGANYVHTGDPVNEATITMETIQNAWAPPTETNVTVANDGSAGTIVLESAGLSYHNPQSEMVRFRVPELLMPKKVYICGRLVTLGMLGSGAEVCFDSSGFIVFEKALAYIAVQDRITISIEYNDYIYHYHVEHNGTVITGRELKGKLVSQVRL